jgi:endonuclease/exonuclease/phosphatase family metal-dependent hydrolase
MLETIAARSAPQDPVLVAGDFNAGADNPAVRVLMAQASGTPGAVPLTDTFRATADPPEQIGTYHAFKGDRGGAKIDAVLASAHWQTLDAAIVHVSDNGHYPSDHFPVTATVVLRRR